MRPSRVLSWLELIMAWLLIIVLVIIVLAVSGALTLIITDSRTVNPVSVFGKPAAAHHSCEWWLAEVVLPRESGGDYTALNMSPSEEHTGWGVRGSYGAYQIALPLWEEERERQGLSEWAGWFPHMTPPAVQDAIALGICQRFGRCPWLFGAERLS